MKIVAEAIPTATLTSMTTDYIFDELSKCIHLQPHETKKINMSLDLTRPSYIIVTKNEKTNNFECNWFIDGEEHNYKIFNDIYYMKPEITKMLKDVDNICDKKLFQKKCYEAYRLDWMMSHGFSIMDIMKILTDSLADQIESDNETIESGSSARTFMQCAIEEFLNIYGFEHNQMFACFDEFIDNEYRDATYMKHLISCMKDSDEMMSKYQKYTQQILSTVPEFSVETTAGVLYAYKSTDPGQPGISIMAKPDGYDDLIDVAYVSVYQEKDYRTADNEGEKDIVIMSYGDATTEDYTTKEIIREKDIVDALSD